MKLKSTTGVKLNIHFKVYNYELFINYSCIVTSELSRTADGSGELGYH
jgi:hypothetical protein